MIRTQPIVDALAIVGAATVLTFIAGSAVSVAIIVGQLVRDRRRRITP